MLHSSPRHTIYFRNIPMHSNSEQPADYARASHSSCRRPATAAPQKCKRCVTSVFPRTHALHQHRESKGRRKKGQSKQQRLHDVEGKKRSHEQRASSERVNNLTWAEQDRRCTRVHLRKNAWMSGEGKKETHSCDDRSRSRRCVIGVLKRNENKGSIGSACTVHAHNGGGIAGIWQRATGKQIHSLDAWLARRNGGGRFCTLWRGISKIALNRREAQWQRGSGRGWSARCAYCSAMPRVN